LGFACAGGGNGGIVTAVQQADERFENNMAVLRFSQADAKLALS
jgi:hypothetical protein